MGSLSVEASGLRTLLGRLATYKVLAWRGTSNDPDMATDRVRMDLADADVVSSALLGSDGEPSDRHMVLLDIDHPAWLVKSSTPGKFHLYIEVPNGIAWLDYQLLLDSLADCGVIEEGYANASKQRGATMLRLPWVKKEQAPSSVSGNPGPWPGPVQPPAQATSDPWDEVFGEEQI